MCALASLAERPKLVENLFVTKTKNKEGVYRIKFCKNGEWVEVTVDDYFPCLPCSGPLFSRANGNEMWVLLLEKAYAKLHGNYFTLRGGFANEGMIDLTGCPSSTYDFQTDKVKALIENGWLFNEMLRFDEVGFLLSASTDGEDRWTESGGPDKKGGLVPGHAYSVI
jgi:calpain-15